MPQYLSPGVYVEEVPSAIRAIAGVSTSTAAFIGIVPDTINLVARNPAAPLATKLVAFQVPQPANQAQLLTSWAEFRERFGDLVGSEDGDALTDAPAPPDPGHRKLAHAVYGYFNNGGSRCYVVRIVAEDQLDAALGELAAIDEISIVCAPGLITDSVRDKLVVHCALAGDRFAILDGPEKETDLTKLTRSSVEAGLAPKRTDLAAWYYPWLKVFDPGAKLTQPDGDGLISAPPSGHVAGIYARVDTARGIFKSPANEAIRGALGVTHPLGKAAQDGLNPTGVNCLRAFDGNIHVWGARTVGGDANGATRYISVRRTLLFLRESIDEGTRWAVFEPNTPTLWAMISRNVTAFLTEAWRSGALFGASPQEAFYVKCDADTNRPSDIENGRVVTEIGVAIARPAEFVIFRVSQSAGEAQ